MPRCQGKTKSGDQCRNNALPGTNYCFLSAHGGSAASLPRRTGNFLRNNILAVVSLILGVTALFLWNADHKQARTGGRLSAVQAAGEHYIAVGATLFKIDAPDGVFLREGNEPVLSIRIEGGKLMVSATIRDAAGNLVAELTDNEWRLNVNNFFDRNYRSDLLEVRDQSGRVVLQVVDLGQVIHFAGIIHCRSGWSYALIPAGDSGAYMEIRPPGEPTERSIEPICRYPSQEHLGECPGLSRIKQIVRVGGGSYRLLKPLEICAPNQSRANGQDAAPSTSPRTK